MMTPLSFKIKHPTSDWRRMLLAFVCGVGFTLAQPPLYIWPILLVCLAGLASLMRHADTGRQAFLIGWFAGFGFFLSGLFWIGEAFLISPEEHAWMLPFAVTLLPAGLALFWGGMTMATWFAVRKVCLIVQDKAARRLYGILFLAVFWMAAEYLRSVAFTGFSWALLSYSLLDTVFSQVLSLMGPYALGGLCVLTFGLIGSGLQGVWKLLKARMRQRMTRISLIDIGSILAGITMIFGLYGYTLWYDQRPFSEVDEPVRVRLVQPNIEQKLKWSEDNRKEIMRKLLSATKAKTGETPDVVVWPESAVPYLINSSTPDMARIRAQIAHVLPEGASLITGTQRQHFTASERDVEWRNSVVVLNKQAKVIALYDKHHLVPFGEYLPLKSVFSALGFRELVAVRGGFTPGVGPQIITRPGIPDFLPLICYEAIFPMKINALPVRPRWMIHITNDAWFGKTTGPLQHLAQARARAIEQGIPVARVANTGITTMIDSRGSIQSYLPLNTYGKIDTLLPLPLKPTPYSHFGELVSFVIVLIISCFTLGHMFTHKRT